MPEACDGSGHVPLEWSSKSCRGTCPMCGRPRVKVKADGTLYTHTIYEKKED